MKITRADLENLIYQLWEHAMDSAELDIFAEEAEGIMHEFGIVVDEWNEEGCMIGIH